MSMRVLNLCHGVLFRQAYVLKVYAYYITTRLLSASDVKGRGLSVRLPSELINQYGDETLFILRRGTLILYLGFCD